MEWLTEHAADVEVYRYYRRQLRMLCAHCRGQHWVFKAPRHLYGLAGLLAAFPDARIVYTHRDPTAILPSLCSLMEILKSPFSDDKFDKHGLGHNIHSVLTLTIEQVSKVLRLALFRG